MKVKEGSVVEITYTGKSEGEVFESVEEPLKIKIGEGRVIKGLEKGLVGCEEGERKEIKVGKEQGFGERNENLIKEIPKSQLGGIKDKVSLEKGKSFELSDPLGGKCIATFKEIKNDSVILDLNHPLAGKNIVYDVHIKKVREG